MGDLMQRLQSAVVFEDADDCSGDLLKADVLAQITALQAENERLREYAIEATKALTGLTVGGSEFFAGQTLGFFKADIPACVKHIRWRFDNARKMGEAKGLSSVNAEAERLREALENMTRRYVDLAGSGDCGFWDPEEEDEVIAARAALKQET